MPQFFQSAAGAFSGKLLAALFIAVCVALGAGPDKWAAFVLGDLPQFGQILARIGFVLLAAIVFGFLAWPKVSSFVKKIEFRWPISRYDAHSSDPKIAQRIFHFRSDIHFDRLEEYLIRLELSFFNCGTEGVLVERVAGLIICDPPFDAFHLETAHLGISQTARDAAARPLGQFGVTIEQRVPRELASLIAQKLDTGLPFSFTLTDLMLWLRPISGGDPFVANLWRGISCKRQNCVVCGKIEPGTGRATAHRLS